MNESEPIYLIASFPDMGGLERAVRALEPAPLHVAVLGNEASGVAEAERLGLERELEPDISLDADQQARLDWHLEHDSRPMLAVRVLAGAGRELRHRLLALGGEMIANPGAAVQVNDVDIEPGTVTDEPPLSPSHDRLSDAITPTGEAHA